MDVLSTERAEGHYVYLYRSANGVPRYVGYGQSPDRAISHADGSHNAALDAFIKGGHYVLEISGPYRDEAEGKSVEAALISALAPPFNVSPGDGHRFRPVGVPVRYADRPAMDPLTVPQIGTTTGGALLVYLAPGDFLSDGRKKFDMADPRDEDALSNTRGRWDVGRHLEQWAASPEDSPHVLIGTHGRPGHRFIVAAMGIDRSRWLDPELKATDRNRYFIPLTEPIDLDVAELRGRRVSDAKFGRLNWQLHIWVDGAGVIRHP